MIHIETILKVYDNTGAIKVKCIRLLGGSTKKKASIGNFVIIAIQRRYSPKRFISKNISLGLIISVLKEIKRPTGYYFKGDANKVILINDQGKLLGTRVFGNIDKSLTFYNCFKKKMLLL